ncbi:hypothetical protein FPHOBKDP_00176 [Listeria phage LPJP1]|nr:hypothetical protein FPHOBKDP_00176 [Listeria phage LPJP1]
MLRNGEEFFNEWSERSGIPKYELKRQWNIMVEMVMDSIMEEDFTKTVLPSIGAFETIVKPPYIARDPRNEKVVIAQVRKRINFRIYRRFKKIVTGLL